MSTLPPGVRFVSFGASNHVLDCLELVDQSHGCRALEAEETAVEEVGSGQQLKSQLATLKTVGVGLWRIGNQLIRSCLQ